MAFNIEDIISDTIVQYAAENGIKDIDVVTLLSQESGPIKSMKKYKIRVFFRKKSTNGTYKKIFETNTPVMSYAELSETKVKVLTNVMCQLLKSRDKVWNSIDTKPQ